MSEKVPRLDRAGGDPRGPFIGVFDSGVGGLSILRALRSRLPEASTVYVGDVSWAPYGSRSSVEVIERSVQVVDWLVTQGATMMVVACNTATVLAIDALRARWPAVMFVGVEPGIKPAAASSRTRRIAVMVTAATATSKRLQYLIEQHAPATFVHVEPCPELATAIECGLLDAATLEPWLRPHCDAIRAANVDTVVLGCTHYPFIAQAITSMLGADVRLADTATAVAERTAMLWLQSKRSAGSVTQAHHRVFSTGATLTFQTLLALCPGLDDTEVEVLTIIPANLPG